jgi:hypothetical protein
MKIAFIFLVFVLFYGASAAFNIVSFGAIPNSDSLIDQFKNQKAILAAIKAASESTIERVVVIPAKKFYTMPIRI